MSADPTERLARVLGMLGSAHDGEVLAAARKAQQLLRAQGLTWQDLLGPAPPALSHEQMLEIYNAGYERGQREAQASAPTTTAPGWRPVDQDLWGGTDPYEAAPHLAEVVDKLDQIWSYRACLSRWEGSVFIPSVAKQVIERGRLSPKQLAIIDRIHREKVPS